jgi:predicted TIM-barrel fold metal-dependent hydrolase
LIDVSARGWDCHVHVFDGAAAVRPGHYLPAHRPLHEIEAVAAAQGIGHLVLVQPSVYGTDNSVMLQALAAGQGRHRGVAVVDASISDDELLRLHAAGVRGVRFNLVSPAGHAGDPGAALQALAPRLRPLGWHVQWYVHADRLPQLAAWQASTGLIFVLDHLAGLHAGLADAAPEWRAAQALAEHGAWIKLSAWYRLAARSPFDELHPHIRRVVQLFGRRCVWGSDWPHTSFTHEPMPSFESCLAPVREALGEAALQTMLRDNPSSLYNVQTT